MSKRAKGTFGQKVPVNVDGPDGPDDPTTATGGGANVDGVEQVMRVENEFLKDTTRNVEEVDRNVNVDEMFKYAVSRHTEGIIPAEETLKGTLKDYQEEALGWMLRREGYTPPALKKNARIENPNWVQIRDATGRPDGTWRNTKTGVVVSQPPVMNAKNQYGDNPEVGISPADASDIVYGGILADEMGLGKTIEMIALIANHEARDTAGWTNNMRHRAGTLIVVPNSLLGTWQRELRKWAPQLKVYVHHDRDRCKDQCSALDRKVVITTYDTMRIDAELLGTRKWWRIILDEAHQIRGGTSGAFKAATAMPARNRWAMTGTPIQNTWRDFYGLVSYLGVKPYGQWEGWYRLIEEPLKTKNNPYAQEAGELLQALISVLVLRRTKQTPGDTEHQLKEYMTIRLRNDPTNSDWLVQSREWNTYTVTRKPKPGESPLDVTARTLQRLPYHYPPGTAPPKMVGQLTYEFIQQLVDIPPKNTKYTPVSMTDDEWELYGKVRQGYRPMGTNGEERYAVIVSSLEKLLRLKQAVIHPWLLRGPDALKKKIGGVYRGEEPWVSSSKMNYLVQQVRETWPNGRRPDEKSLIFSQFTQSLDLLEVALKKNSWISQHRWRQYDPLKQQRLRDRPRYVRIDGSMTSAEREEAMADLENDENVKLALLSLLATGVGLTLTRANNVYFLDMAFNPQLHAQATDRTHRIGQTRPVNVELLVAVPPPAIRNRPLKPGQKREQTLDESLIALLDYKKRLARFTLDPVRLGKDQVASLIQ